MKKYHAALLGGAITLAAIGIAWLAHHKSTKALGELADLALDDSSELGTFFPSLDKSTASSNMLSLLNAVRKQLVKVKAKTALTDPRSAEDVSLFWTTARNEAGAWVKCAYWLAVAARVSQFPPELVKAAKSYAAKAYALGALPGSSLKKSGTQGIYERTASLIGALPDSPNIRSILATLRENATVGARNTVDQAATERSVSGKAAGFAESVGHDVSTVSSVIRGLFTGKSPTGMGSGRWTVLKWGIRLAIIGSIALGIRLMLGPEISKIKAAIGTVKMKAKAIGQIAGSNEVK